jgi:uncharacterized phage protein (TIGR01671 family)
MRESKFRAFIKHLNCITDVLSIDFMNKEVEVYLDDRDEIRIYPFDEVERLQFTGLTDKNGREIYEGDLLTDYGEAPPVYVEYSEKHGAYCFVDKFDPSGTVYYTPLMIYYDQMEVIGNIYEDPELLETKE